MKIRPYTSSDEADFLRIWMELSHLKIGPVTGLTFDENVQLVHDLGLFSADQENILLAEEDGVILGVLVLDYKDLKKTSSPRKGPFHLLKTYGLTRLIQLTQLGRKMTFKHQPGELYIDSISVSAEARGKGVGTLLLHAAETYRSEHGFEVLSLIVIQSNTKAKALYKRLGFEVEKEVPLSKKYRAFFGCDSYFYMVKQIP